MAFGEIAAARLPDPGDGQMPLRGAAAFWLGGRGEFGIGGDKQAKPLRLARAEPVHQVVQVVAVVSRCHGGGRLRLLVSGAGLPGPLLSRADAG
jgi:hypothetical protein